MVKEIIISSIFVFLSLFTLSIALDYGEIVKRAKKGALKGSQAIENIRSGSKLFEVIKITDNLIDSSNIRNYVNYPISLHLIICLASGMAVFSYVASRLNILMGLTASFMGALIPYAILRFIADAMNLRTKKNALDFFVILKNYFKSSKDIFEAFEKAKESYQEPLKTYTEIMVYEQKNGISSISAIRGFISKVRHHEIKLFMENLQIAIITGGNLEALLDEAIKEISELQDIEEKEDGNDKILNYGLYGLLMMNFIMIKTVMRGEYRNVIIHSLWGQVVFALDIVISIYIIISTLRRE